MDSSEYRKQYAEHLERVDKERGDYRDYLDKSKSVSERQQVLKGAPSFIEPNQVAEALGVIEDKDEDPELRASTLYKISTAASTDNQLMDLLLKLIKDDAEAPVV